jgi:hypothetical protein
VRETAELHATRSDPYWTYNFGPGNEYRQGGGMFSWVQENHELMRMQSCFLCDTKDDNVAHALEPFYRDLGTMITSFHDFWQGRPISAANALITLWVNASQENGPDELAAAYDTCLQIAIHGFAPFDVKTRAGFRDHFIRQLATDYHRLPASWLGDAIKQIREAGKSTKNEGSELIRMASEILPELMAEEPSQPL